MFWLREALKRYFVVETKEERILCTTSAAAIHIFMVRVPISFMHNALIILVPCCESNILFFFAQKISASVFSSAEICMCIGMQEYYVPGMVCGPCVLMMRRNLLNFFVFLESVFCLGSFTLGVKNNPPFVHVCCEV